MCGKAGDVTAEDIGAQPRVMKTLNGEIFARVRSEILAGHLRPGARLRPAELAQEHSVSLSVVREALARLAEQELVDWVPQTGFRVAPLSVEDLQDLTDVRLDIEVLAIRYAVQRGDVAWEGRVLAAHHILERTRQFDPDDPDRFTEEWAQAHANFHNTLLSGCNSRRLIDIAAQLRDGSELYRRWSHALAHDYERDIPAEHRSMLKAVLERDQAAAEEALGAHIRHTTNALLHDVEAETP
jgi:DNA-binding GntR family transcriptional regulator